MVIFAVLTNEFQEDSTKKSENESLEQADK
jgi:hypothetical protein